jgi:two-component system response regulator FlrC
MANRSFNATWTMPTPEAAPSATDLQSAARMNEHQVIMATLAATPSKTEAAKRLGISPRTLRYKLAQLREHGLSMANAY